MERFPFWIMNQKVLPLVLLLFHTNQIADSQYFLLEGINLVDEIKGKEEEKDTYNFNCFCHQFTSTPRKGWRLRNFTYTKLCGPCFFAYSDGSFCQKHHRHEDGWRQCDVCERRVHCGCIMSLHLFETNDTSGVTCKKCLDKMGRVVSIRGTSSSTLDECCTGLDLLATSAIEYFVADPTISAEPTNARDVLADPTTARVVSADPTIGDAPAGSEDDHNSVTIIGDAPAELAIKDAHANLVTRDASTDSSIITDAAFADPATGDVPANLAIIGDVVDPSIPATIRDALADPANTKNAPDLIIIGDAHVAPTITRDAPRDAIIGDAPTTIIRYAFALPDPTITEDALVDPTITRDALANPTVTEDAPAAPAIIGDAIIRDAPADPVIIKDTLASPTTTGNVLVDPSMDDASADPIVRDAIRDASVDPFTIKGTFASFAIIGDSPAHPAISDASGNAIVDASRNPSIIGDASADPSIIRYASNNPTIISDVDHVIVGDASIDPTNVKDADPVIVRNAFTDLSTRDDPNFPVAEDVSVELVARGVSGDAFNFIEDGVDFMIQDGFASNPIDLATEYASVYPPIIRDAYSGPLIGDAYYPTIEDTLADSFTGINYAFSSVHPTIGNVSDVTDSTIGAVFDPAATSAITAGDDLVASASDIGDGFDSSTFRCANTVIGNACADHSVSAVSAKGPEAPEPGTE